MKHMINRRSFLTVTVGAAAMAALGPYSYCAAPKRNLRKAIMYSTIGVKGSVLEKFRAMKEAGFEGADGGDEARRSDRGFQRDRAASRERLLPHALGKTAFGGG